MTLWNIVQKSYNRRSAILISLCFFLGFLVSAVLAVSSANRAIAILNNVVQNSPAGSNQGTRQGIKDGLY
jgi:predicted PurR-regulated permease PerM